MKYRLIIDTKESLATLSHERGVVAKWAVNQQIFNGRVIYSLKETSGFGPAMQIHSDIAAEKLLRRRFPSISEGELSISYQ